MKNINTNADKDALNLKRAYILALALIFTVACFKYFFMAQLIQQQEDDASVINISGRQRMLSQRIALFSLENMQNKSDQARLSTASDLTDTVNEFERNHMALIDGNTSLNIPRLNNPEIQAVYFDDPKQLDRRVKAYINNARQITLQNANSESLRYILQEGPNALLNDLNTVVVLHEQAARKKTQETLKIQGVFLLLTTLVLLLEALLLFRPLVNRIREYVQELEERQNIIKQQNKELEHFTYIASHNLREPLRKITSFSQKLSENIPAKNKKDVETCLDFIIAGAAQMRDLVDGLQAYATVLSTHKNDMRDISADDAVKLAMERQKSLISESGGDILYNDLPILFYNPALLTQLFEILINNAVRYSGEDTPKIEILATKEEDFYRFEVRDNGFGIAENHLDKVFTMFQRLHRKEEIPGIGAGLSVARRIVEFHGGHIWVTSTPGDGSSFFFTVPTT